MEKKYNQSIEIDQADFDEKRTNILLNAGFHYSKRNSKYYEKLRDNKFVSEDVKLRITKNHINKGMKIYINNLLSFAPGATITAHDERNIHDKVQAELARAVWEDGKYRMNYAAKRRACVEDKFILGETFIKVYYEPNAGDIIGFAPLKSEDTGEIEFDEAGAQKPDKTKPVFEGDIKTEILKAYDIFYDRDALSIDDSTFIGIKKLIGTDELIQQIKNDDTIPSESKEQYMTDVKGASKSSYTAFVGLDTMSQSVENKTLVKEFWFKPSALYPMGYYYITVSNRILWEGELQKDKYGKPLYPIIWCFCDEFQSARRGASPIRQVRPCQAEINRTASKIAETQITLGDDKVITTAGAGITEGSKLNGLRQVVLEQGGTFEVIPGRSGEQYLPYLESQIKEFYTLLGVNEDSEEKNNGQDVVATLYYSMKNRKKFMFYAEKFERFLCEWTKVYIELAKRYFRDDKIIRCIGTSEAINIQEFKQTDERAYAIRVIAQNDDVDTMLGQYLMTVNTMQYGNLDKEGLGRLADEMPFLKKGLLSHLTTDYTEARNICLALDRGEMPTISKYDNNEYICNALIRRMREPDYKYLTMKNPQIDENYNKQYDERDQIVAQKIQELKAANQGIIPTGGPQMKVDAYVPAPDGSGKSVRASISQDAFNWLLERLGQQGAAMEEINQQLPQAQVQTLGRPKVVPMNNTVPQGQEGGL